MAAGRHLCGSRERSRFRCARFASTVLCRDCCIEQFDDHHCVWWDLCDATDVKQWERLLPAAPPGLGGSAAWQRRAMAGGARGPRGDEGLGLLRKAQVLLLPCPKEGPGENVLGLGEWRSSEMG